MTETKTKDEGLLPFQEALLDRLKEAQAETTPMRTRRRPIVWGVAAAASLVAVFAVALAGAGSITSPRTRETQEPGPLFLAAEVSAAVADTDNMILHTTEVSSSPGQPDLRFESWWDRGTGEVQRTIQRDAAGKAMNESVFTKQGDKGVVVVIDHETSTWWTRSRTLVDGDGKKRVFSPAPITIRFRDELAQGEVEIIGEESIRGVETLHVRDNSKPGLRRDFWIFMDSYLPLHRVTTDEFGNRFEMTFEWLPRNEENLRLLQPDLTGMKQVDPPAEAPRGPDGGLG